MKLIGTYCKAYETARLAEFPGWPADLGQAQAAAGEGDDVERRDYLYLQENFNVTRGIFLDEGVVFDAVTPEWVEFCRETLKFEPPSEEE
jgi:hypothetical protein